MSHKTHLLRTGVAKNMDTVLFVNASSKSESLRLKLAGVRRYAQLRKWNVQPVYAATDASAIASYIKTFAPIGAILETRGCCCSADGRSLRRLPVVYLDVDPGEYGKESPVVVHDQEATVRMAMREFAQMGLGHFAYAGWFSPVFWSAARARAFAAAARKAGATCAVFAPECGEDRQIEYEKSLSPWLESLPSGTGLLAANDQIASLVLAGCRRLGIVVPQEIAVLGVDNDVSCCESESPTLTSIQLDFENAGYKAGELLDKIISGAPLKSKRVVFGPLGVIRRKSTQTFPRMNPRITAAMELIRAKACEDLSAQEVAAVIGGSRRLAEMRFREATGKSILEEIQRVRFERIFFFLANTTKPIGAIANFCGYKSPETLRRLFQKRTGMSMREWRNEHAAPSLRKRL